MQSIPLSAVLTPGAKCWGHGPPGLAGLAWPGPEALLVDLLLTCGTPLGIVAGSCLRVAEIAEAATRRLANREHEGRADEQ